MTTDSGTASAMIAALHDHVTEQERTAEARYLFKLEQDRSFVRAAAREALPGLHDLQVRPVADAAGYSWTGMPTWLVGQYHGGWVVAAASQRHHPTNEPLQSDQWTSTRVGFSLAQHCARGDHWISRQPHESNTPAQDLLRYLTHMNEYGVAYSPEATTCPTCDEPPTVAPIPAAAPAPLEPRRRRWTRNR